MVEAKVPQVGSALLPMKFRAIKFPQPVVNQGRHSRCALPPAPATSQGQGGIALTAVVPLD